MKTHSPPCKPFYHFHCNLILIKIWWIPWEFSNTNCIYNWRYANLRVRQCERLFFSYFCVSQKTKQIYFLNRIWTRKQTGLPYLRKFRETNAEVNAKLKVRNHCTKIIEYYDYNRHFRQSAAVNWSKTPVFRLKTGVFKTSRRL